MSRAITVRLARPEDSDAIVEWGQEHLEDLEVLVYPTAQTLCAENGRPIQFATVHGVTMIEGLSSNPAAGPGELALALRDLERAICAMSRRVGIREILFMTGPEDGRLEKAAARRGYEKVPWTVWRRKL